MRRLLVLATAVIAVIAVMAALPGHAATRVVVISDASLAPKKCVGHLEASTGDVAVRGRTVAATWTIGADRATGIAVSRDGGRSFQRSAVRDTSSCVDDGPADSIVDPDLELGADGTPWLSLSSGLRAPRTPGVLVGDKDSVLLVKVGDAKPVSVFSGTAVERGFLETDAVDPTSALVLSESLVRASVHAGGLSRAFGTVYTGGSLLLGRTTDRGRTWTTSTLRTVLPGSNLLALGLTRVGSTYIALSAELDLQADTVPGLLANGLPPAIVSAQRSVDGGRSWSAPISLGRVSNGNIGDVAAGGGVVAFAAAQGNGSLLVWTSRDAGRTWTRSTAATKVLDASTAVAIDERGRIGVLSYRDIARDAEGAPDITQPQVSISRDGRTWAKPVPLGPSFSLAKHPGAGHVKPLGAYQGGAGMGRELLIAFTTAGRGGHTEVRLARLR